MSMNKPVSSDADLKLIPTSILKNLRATAAIVCYDLLMKQKSMTKQCQLTFLYDAFHGNEEKNIISQIGLLMKGRGVYSNLFTMTNVTPVTDKNIQNIPTEIEDRGSRVFALHSRFCHDGRQYIAGKHFTAITIQNKI